MSSVLIVEDEIYVIRVLERILKRAGHSVTSAPNGMVALERVREQHPEVLITDINMPSLNGRELCMKIKEEFPEREFPILVLTSRTEIEHREWTRDIENTYFIEKPVSSKKLLATISAALDISEK